jgi:uncharacterized protein YggT (Ycf19 family)
MIRRRTPTDERVYEERVEPSYAPAHEEVVDSGGLAIGRMVTQLLSLVLWVVLGLIATRLILALLGANETAGFVAFINNVTQPLVAPFVGIFETVPIGAGVLEPASLIALIVYGIVGALIIQLVSSLFHGTRRVVSRY